MELNVIYHQSCLDGLKQLPDECVDMIFTDPPYYQYRAQNVQGLKNHKDLVTEFEFDGFESEEHYLNFLEEVLVECYRVCKPGAAGYLWCGDDFVSYLNRMVERVGFQFRKVIHWHKTNPFPAIYTRKMFANSMEMLVHFSKGTPKTWNHKPVNDHYNLQALLENQTQNTEHHLKTEQKMVRIWNGSVLEWSIIAKAISSISLAILLSILFSHALFCINLAVTHFALIFIHQKKAGFGLHTLGA